MDAQPLQMTSTQNINKHIKTPMYRLLHEPQLSGVGCWCCPHVFKQHMQHCSTGSGWAPQNDLGEWSIAHNGVARFSLCSIRWGGDWLGAVGWCTEESVDAECTAGDRHHGQSVHQYANIPILPLVLAAGGCGCVAVHLWPVKSNASAGAYCMA